MVLLSIDFANLYTILESLYKEMMPFCEDMMDVGKGLAGLGALFYYGRPGMAVAGQGRADRRLSFASSLCHRYLYPAFPDFGIGNNE